MDRLNARYGHPIPHRIRTKPSSPNLRPGQTMEEDLPSHVVLDPILRALVDEGLPLSSVHRRFGGSHVSPDELTRIAGFVERGRTKIQLLPFRVLKLSRNTAGAGYTLPIARKLRIPRAGRGGRSPR
jgi:NH3-dependent NAD+ synthetase